MGLKIPGHNTLRIQVEFPGATPPTHARVGILDNTVHRVINPRRDNVATFHDVPAGPTHAVVTVKGLSVAKKKVVVPATGELAVTVRARGDDAADADDAPYRGGFTLVDERTGQPLRGRKYRITSAGGVDVTGETDADGKTRMVGTDRVETLHLELQDDELGHIHPDHEPDDDDDDDDEDDDAPDFEDYADDEEAG